MGEEWAASLQQYFATAGAYDVYDEKVMEETTFYGLPFWHFSTAGSGAGLHAADDERRPAHRRPERDDQLPGPRCDDAEPVRLYRPILPITSQEVTSSSLPARGLWIKSLVTNDVASTATIGYPTIDLAAHEPVSGIRPIFFPASPFMLEHSIVFGKQRDYAERQLAVPPRSELAGEPGIQRNIVVRAPSSSSTRIPPTGSHRSSRR